MKKKTLVICAAVLAATSASGQVQVQSQQVGPTPGAQQAAPPPCPGLGGLEIGFTRAFSFERMAKLEPDKQKVTRDVKVEHKPLGRAWVITVTFDSDAAEAKIVGLYYLIDPYLIDPPQSFRDALKRYGDGTPLPTDASQTYWDISRCGVRLRYRSRMNDKQRPIEELWVDPIPAKASQQQKKKG